MTSEGDELYFLKSWIKILKIYMIFQWLSILAYLLLSDPEALPLAQWRRLLSSV